MAILSHSAFKQRQAAAAAYRESRENGESNNRVSFFSLKAGEEAIVRFAYDSVEDMEYVTYHHAGNGDFQSPKVACLRGEGDNFDSCPMCKAGYGINTRVYLKLIQYTRDDEGNITATPKLWERSAKFVDTNLSPLEEEYGDLKGIVMKVKRNGTGRDNTTYTCVAANPKVYNETLYPLPEGTEFDGVQIEGRFVKTMTFEEMQADVANSTPATSAPASAPRRPSYN